MLKLTKKQKEVYDYICSYTLDYSYAPTQKEIKEHFNLKSYGSVQKYLKYLTDAEYIRTDWNARRGIEPIFETHNDLDHKGSSTINLPLLGNVAAGNPIEAIENPLDEISVPKAMLKGQGRFYALKVQGESMIEDGILDLDILLCRYTMEAQSGETVVAVVDGESTVKKFYPQENQIELAPANSNYKSIIVHPHQKFKIVGVPVGLIRQF